MDIEKCTRQFACLSSTMRTRIRIALLSPSRRKQVDDVALWQMRSRALDCCDWQIILDINVIAAAESWTQDELDALMQWKYKGCAGCRNVDSAAVPTVTTTYSRSKSI